MLTEKQKRFIDYFIETGNATQAAERAGYKGKNLNRIGSENLSKLDVYIKEKLKEKDAERIASQDEVLRYLTSVLRGEELEEVVVVEGMGEGVSEARLLDKAVNQKDRIRAAELLGKRYGIFNDKISLDADTSLNITIDYEGGADED